MRSLVKILCFVLPWLALAMVYSLCCQYGFYWQEQNQLFLNTPTWLSTYFGRPGWLGCMVGDFLTQFYYYTYVGPVILSTVVSLTGALVWLYLRPLRHRWLRTVLSVAFWLLLAAMTMDLSCRLATVMCLLGGVACYPLCRCMRLWGWIGVLAAGWLFGVGALLTALMLAFGAWRDNRAGIVGHAAMAALPVAAALLAPIWSARHYTLRYVDALTWPGLCAPTLPDAGRQQALAVECEYYFGNYDRAAELALNVTKPDAVSSFYYYLAQARRDSLPEHLLDYPVKDLGTLQTIGETTPLAVVNMINDLYFALGDMTYAERAAMMRNVFSPQNRNVRMIRRLAEINLAADDSLAALKYLRILSKTHAYKDWALSFMTPDGGIRPEALGTRKVNTCHTLRLGDNCRNILIELLDSDPDNTLALDYLLCTDLLLKQMDAFKADYDRYCVDTGRQRLRPLYQQALMVYLAGTGASDDEWTRYIHSPRELARFRAYNARRGDPAFADTYWYYFDTVK